MRSNGRYIGYGTSLAFVEEEETWRDKRVAVRLPNDTALDDPIKLAELSSEVDPYNLGD